MATYKEIVDVNDNVEITPIATKTITYEEFKDQKDEEMINPSTNNKIYDYLIENFELIYSITNDLKDKWEYLSLMNYVNTADIINVMKKTMHVKECIDVNLQNDENDSSDEYFVDDE
jgi:hypothetical protein